MRRLILMCSAVLLLWAASSQAGTITRPGKSFGGTSFITGVVPTAADFNGDIDTAYSEINGSLSNVNISASAAIAGSKISPAFTLDTSITTGTPCLFWTESDQAADAQRWYACVSDSVWQLHTRTDAGVVQATPIQINRSTGAVTFVAATFATQVQMEAATSLVLPVTPASTQYHPGVAKGWVKCNTAGTISISYNVTSITDVGTGVVDVTWSTVFSSANYVVQATSQTGDPGANISAVSNTTVPTAGVTRIVSSNDAGAATDPSYGWHIVAFGDQ